MTIKPLAPYGLVMALVMGSLVPLQAQEAPTPAPRSADTLGWYVVRPGDTLEAITELYLGTPLLWKENWRLNPDIKNPHLLRIGQRIRIIAHRQLPERMAEIENLARRVDEKPHPNPWIAARQGDLLQRKDGLRTHHGSSAELRFGDGLELLITEDSLVFLNDLEMDVLGRTRDGIEIVQGQADLKVHRDRPEQGAIEVRVGSVRAEPRPGSGGKGSSRFARAENGGARVMVFTGRSTVASGGSTIDVPEGMGTRVPQGKPPAPPEKLLRAPVLSKPAAGWRAPWANPVLSWEAVPGAQAYTVEIFSDARGTRLVERKQGVRGTSWAPQRLPKGSLHWRVTAVSRSGLDGYPARLRSLNVTAGLPDIEAPVVVAVPLAGVRFGEGHAVAGPHGLLRLEAHDDLSGVESIVYRWDDEAWRRMKGDTLRVPAGAGTHVLEFWAKDRRGRRSITWKVPVEIEGAAPAPPRVGRGNVPAGGRTR